MSNPNRVQAGTGDRGGQYTAAPAHSGTGLALVGEQPHDTHAPITPPVSRHYQADGSVAARQALAQIARDKPPVAELTLEYSRTKKSGDFPDIHPPEGTVLAVTTRSGFYALPITGGRVVVRAHSAFGNPVHIFGGDVHIVTDGGDRKVSVTVKADDPAHPPNVTVGADDADNAADPGSRTRLRIYDEPARTIVTPTVRTADSDDIPTDWRPPS